MAITPQQLRSLIGLRLRFRGEPHVVIEIIEDELAVVLASEEAPSIQGDAYGNARRQARTLVTVPVLTPDGTALHPQFLQLDLD